MQATPAQVTAILEIPIWPAATFTPPLVAATLGTPKWPAATPEMLLQVAVTLATPLLAAVALKLSQLVAATLATPFGPAGTQEKPHLVAATPATHPLVTAMLETQPLVALPLEMPLLAAAARATPPEPTVGPAGARVRPHDTSVVPGRGGATDAVAEAQHQLEDHLTWVLTPLNRAVQPDGVRNEQ